MEAITAIATVVLVIITGVYVHITGRMLAEMKEDRQQALRPYLFFDFIHAGLSVQAALRNSGRSSAYDVRIKVSPDIPVRERGDIGVSKLAATTIPQIVPDREILESLGTWNIVTNDGQRMKFTGELIYKDSRGNEYREDILIDLEWRKDMMKPAATTIQDEIGNVAEELSQMRSTINQIDLT